MGKQRAAFAPACDEMLHAEMVGLGVSVGLLLGIDLPTIVRGLDVIGAAGRSPRCLTSIAERAFACLPITNTNAHNKRRDRNRSGSARNRA